MVIGDPLYFLADPGKYRSGKINLLSAQSSVLLSREIVKKIIDLRYSEKVYRTKIASSVTELKMLLVKLDGKLPRTRRERSEVIVHKVGIKKEFSRSSFDNPIRDELSIIQDKLKELEG